MPDRLPYVIEPMTLDDIDQVMEIEVPEMLKSLRKGLGDLADPEKIDWEA